MATDILPDQLSAQEEVFVALVAILKARVVDGNPLIGNPYLIPVIQQGLKAVANMRGFQYQGPGRSYLDALEGL